MSMKEKYYVRSKAASTNAKKLKEISESPTTENVL